MCRSVTCRTCGKATWAGCGRHVQQVMAPVPPADRCAGHPDGQGSQSPGWLARVLSRG